MADFGHNSFDAEDWGQWADFIQSHLGERPTMPDWVFLELDALGKSEPV